MSTHTETNLDPDGTPYTEVNSNWVRDLASIKLKERWKKAGEMASGAWVRQRFHA